MRRFCPKCREWKNTEEKFCNKCGAELQGASKFESRENIQSELPEREDSLYDVPNTNTLEQSNNMPTAAADKKATNTVISTADKSQMSSRIEQLKTKVGIYTYTECSNKEHSNYEKMLENGEQIPPNIEKIKGLFYKKDTIPPDEQQLYLMMRISKDLHFIRVVLQATIILSAIAAILTPIIMNTGK